MGESGIVFCVLFFLTLGLLASAIRTANKYGDLLDEQKDLFEGRLAIRNSMLIGAARIKPIDWKDVGKKGVPRCVGTTIFGQYYAYSDGWTATNETWFDSGSIHEAKAAAEAHYRNRLATALELVKEA